MSANNSISLVNIKAIDTTKEIKRDEFGYYKITLGEFNNYSGNNHFYLVDGIREILTDSNNYTTARKLEKGALYGEMGHPYTPPGVDPNAALHRNLYIEPQNTSHHIRSVELVPTNTPSPIAGAGNIIKVVGWIKPSGPKGDLLEQSLSNPYENTAFSIRALHRFISFNGQKVKRLINIITWDWVQEPGIKTATKWSSLSLESKHICNIELEQLKQLKTHPELTIEHDNTGYITELLRDSGGDTTNFLRRW